MNSGHLQWGCQQLHWQAAALADSQMSPLRFNSGPEFFYNALKKFESKQFAVSELHLRRYQQSKSALSRRSLSPSSSKNCQVVLHLKCVLRDRVTLHAYYSWHCLSPCRTLRWIFTRIAYYRKFAQSRVSCAGFALVGSLRREHGAGVI